jgi:hypothetical protein
MSVRTLLIAASFWLAWTSPRLATAQTDLLTPFLKQYCLDCHSGDDTESGVRLDRPLLEPLSTDDLTIWQQALDQLKRGEMPPREEPQPSPETRQQISELLQSALNRGYAEQTKTGQRPAIRRLNRIELRNTLRDLLYLEQPMFRNLGVPKPEDLNGDGSVSRHSDDPIREFPADELEHGFDNIGSRLVMSDFLLRLLVGAAEECLELATVSRENAKPKSFLFSGHIRTEGPGGLESLSREFNPDYDVLLERYREPGAASNVGRVAPSKIAGTGVGVSGRYRITIEVSAHHRHHPWQDFLRSRQDEPFLLGLHLIDSRRGAFNEGNPNTEQLTQWELPDDGQRHSYSWETWIDAAWLPWIGWENAPYERSLTLDKLAAAAVKAPARLPAAPSDQATDREKDAYRRALAGEIFSAGYSGPQIRIYSLSIEPLFGDEPPQGHRFLYGATGRESPNELLLAFANRAWRRPVAAEELSRYQALMEARLALGETREEALRAAYTALLCSPNFYYLRDLPEAPDYQLAAKLSYFLWSSMPDQELFELAAAGKLSDPQIISQQVERLLNHRNNQAFVRRFTASWLRLDKLGSMPPPGGFYFHRQMETQMLKQTDAYFADLLQRNGPLRDLIDSDYTFLNERTAQWIYLRDDVWGDAFRKVPAKPPHGGGMLTMPAVMTSTANGVDTSPVIRGVWMLESVLGTPPAPPPPNVQPLSPDLRGKQTVREQLEAHRADNSCKVCHDKIDPLGFAFENFDELGLWRTHYRNGGPQPIDSSSTWTDGRTIKDISVLKLILLEQEELIARNFIEKLLTYASGRSLTGADRPEIDQILADCRSNGFRLREIVQRIVRSPIFLGH